MELKLVAKLQQSLVMTPQLKMAIKLLTLNHLELKDAVAQELIENPVLEEIPDDQHRALAADTEGRSDQQVVERPAEVNLGSDSALKDAGQNIDWDSYADSYNFLPPAAGSGKDTSFDDLPGIDQTLSRSATLEEHILWQVQMSDMNDLERSIAVRLLGEMNDDGFLDAAPVLEVPKVVDVNAPPAPPAGVDDDVLDDTIGSDHEDDDDASEPVGDKAKSKGPALRIDPVMLIADELDVPVEWVEAVRKRIMKMDPVGVMSRDLQECLLTQLDVWGYDADCLEWRIVDIHMKDAERHNFAAIARNEKCTMEDVGAALKVVEQLEPRPARNFIAQGTMPDSNYISPDVYVQRMGDELIILLNEDGLPKLKMSKFYLDQIRNAQAAKDAGQKVAADPSRTYIKEKMRSAAWLMKSIHQRQRTIYRVMEAILNHQREWFEGNGPLKPLILKDVADDIEMHESTVSRVTSRKYVHTPRGVFELKYFFNSSINTGDGANIASEAVKDEIKRAVDAENPKKPLSDSQLVTLLKDKNIEIARRTVAKYREMLGILPSSKRKKVF